MNLVLFGANGPTGRILTRQALAAGHCLTAVTRHPELFPLYHERLQIVRGDVFAYETVERAIAGQDTVLSSLGVPYSRKPITVYSRGTAHIVQAMRNHSIGRLVCVSSSVTDPQLRFHDTGGGFVFEKVVKPLLITTFGRTLYEDMWRMEELVTKSGLDWTIVRPSGLFDTPTVTPYQMAETFIRGRYTSRIDLADCMLHQLTSDRFVHKTLAVVTTTAQPSLVQLIMREALQQRPS